MSLFSASLAHVRTSAVSVAAHGHQSSATSQDSSKYSQRHQPGASDHNSTRYAAGSPTNTVNSTLSLTKATPYSTRATKKIPAPLWPLRWCRPSSPTVKNQPSSLTVQPRPLHLSLRCFWPRPLMMKHRARRQCQHCLAHRLDAREAYLDEDAHDLLAGLHPATPRVRSAASAAPAATRHCRRRAVGRGGRSLDPAAARWGCFSCPVPNLAHFNTQPSTVAPPQSNGSRSDLAVWRRVRAPSAHRAISYETPASRGL